MRSDARKKAIEKANIACYETRDETNIIGILFALHHIYHHFSDSISNAFSILQQCFHEKKRDEISVLIKKYYAESLFSCDFSFYWENKKNSEQSKNKSSDISRIPSEMFSPLNAQLRRTHFQHYVEETWKILKSPMRLEMKP